jgi:hypothetical protein
LSDDEIRFPFVIKPAVGFFCIGVHIVEKDWIKAKSEYNLINLKVYSENVLNTSNFIIEEFIQGRICNRLLLRQQWRCCFVKRFTSPFSSGTDMIGFIQHPQSLKSIKLILNILKSS